MELGNQVSCKIRGGWGGGCQKDNPREEALHRPQHVCVRKYRILWCRQDGGPQPATHTRTLDTGWQDCRESLLPFLLVDF